MLTHPSRAHTSVVLRSRATTAIELAPNSPDHVHLILLEEEEDDDKKIELMVLMSTSHVNPHISGCISSASTYLFLA